MRMFDIIKKKRDGFELTKEEIGFFIEKYTSNEINDYQASALLMAIYFKGMTKEETINFTLAMAHSGDMIDLSSINGIKVDKHSTGGVGDKTTLVVAPIVAACGLKVAKMSGRGLGHTGGTVDKLESISGLKTSFTMLDFINIVNKTGIAVIGQSSDLAPADKKLYHLRDVTATIDSIPMIAASIMSKKLASGADCIVLDVKVGSGAFMKNIEDATKLARIMVDIAYGAGKKCTALITDMDIPLGENVGNILEVIEAIDVLNGKGPKDLIDESIIIATHILMLAGCGDVNECEKKVAEVITNKKALNCFLEMVKAQSGNIDAIVNNKLFPVAEFAFDILSSNDGYISHMDTEKIGTACVILGGGREKITDSIDYTAGIKIHKKTGDIVKVNDVIATIYTNDKNKIDIAKNLYKESICYSQNSVEHKPLILAKVTKDNIEVYHK